MSEAVPVPVALREMRWWDIEAVLELEDELFPEDAWSPGMFWSELAHARGPFATRRYVVADEGGRIVGYGGLAAVGGVADVQTIGVTRDHWGGGLGARLLTELLRHATSFESSEVLLEVRVDNTRAQKLYQRFGFEPIGFRKGYYQPGNVDALVMRRDMKETPGEISPARAARSSAGPVPAGLAPAGPVATPPAAPVPDPGSGPPAGRATGGSAPANGSTAPTGPAADTAPGSAAGSVSAPAGPGGTDTDG